MSKDLRFNVAFKKYYIHLPSKDIEIEAYSYTVSEDGKSIMFWMPAKGLPYLVREGGKVDPHHWDCVGSFQLDDILGFSEKQ